MNIGEIFNYAIKHDYHLILIYILLGILLYKIFSFFVGKMTKKVNVKRKATVQKLVRNILKYAIITLVIVQILSLLGLNVTSIAAGLGIAGIIVGLAFQDIMKDVLVGLSIIFEEQFDVGDYVSINGFEGTVVDLGLKSTKLKSYENVVRVISNRNISEVTNYSKKDIKVRINIPIPYEIETKKADKIVEKIVDRIENEMKLVEKVDNWGLNKFNSSDIEYTILVPVKPEEQWRAKRMVNRIIKEEFDKAKISIPFDIIEVRNG